MTILVCNHNPEFYFYDYKVLWYGSLVEEPNK